MPQSKSRSVPCGLVVAHSVPCGTAFRERTWANIEIAPTSSWIYFILTCMCVGVCALVTQCGTPDTFIIGPNDFEPGVLVAANAISEPGGWQKYSINQPTHHHGFAYSLFSVAPWPCEFVCVCLYVCEWVWLWDVHMCSACKAGLQSWLTEHNNIRNTNVVCYTQICIKWWTVGTYRII